MSRDLSSIRLSRLNSLILAFYSSRRMTKDQLMNCLEYSNPRTLERDLAFLRDEYAVDIIYDRSARQYIFNGRGKFLVSTTLTEREVTAMAAGLRMAAHFLPHLQEPSRDLWSKFKGVLPRAFPKREKSSPFRQ